MLLLQTMFGLKRLHANCLCYGRSLSSPPELFPIILPLGHLRPFISFLISDICVCVTGLRWSLGQEDVQDEPPAQPEGLVGDVPLEESLVILVSDRLMKI